MAPTDSKRATLVLLDESSSSDALVQMKDGDKFLVPVAAAALACRAVESFDEFSGQFQHLLDFLHEWVSGRRELVRSAHLTVRESDLLFLLVQKQVGYHDQLNDDLTDLDLEIANSDDFRLLSLEVMAVPPASPDSYQAFQSSGATFDHAK